MESLLAARLQMAFTLGWHIIVACFGVGMPVLLLVAEWKANRTGDPVWRSLAERWSKAFAVLFAVGAVSGTVLSFELGLLWPKFMGTFGSVIGLPFTLEAFAFFFEAIFVGIYLYGWKHLRPWVHWCCGIPIALSGAASAWFVVTANAWMNSPQGFTYDDEVVSNVQPFVAMLNPATGMQTAHMLCAAYMVTGFCIASYYGYLFLKGNTSRYVQKAMIMGFVLGAMFSPIQIVVGDWAAKVVARTQPVKFAAMEGQFETQQYAPLRIGGVPNMEQGTTQYALELPGLLSLLAFGERSATVRGLNEFPKDRLPPVGVVHFAFQLMVGAGTFLAALALIGGSSLLRRQALFYERWFLCALVCAGPAAVLALEAGWTVTEVGRQPWIVQGYMRTAEAVTEAPGIVYVFIATIALYLVLTIGSIAVLRHLARKPLPEGARDAA